jgi:moderate conductance mechanosensitive channel
MKELFTSEFWVKAYDSLESWIITELPSLILSIFIILIAFRVIRFFLSRLRKRLIKRAEKSDQPDESGKRVHTLMNILHSVIKIILWLVFFITVLGKFGIDIAPILASAGIVGLAVGFGAQELVRDFISGFFMLLENQIREGDVAVINGTGGLVETIELRTTTLRDFSGVVHVFQNGKINTLSNMTKEWSAMVFDIGVAYKENTDQVMEIMKKVGEELQNDAEFGPSILEPIEVFGLEQFGDSAIVIKARIKTKPIQQWNVGREYRKRLKYAFDERNIEIPFPHTTIYWGEEIKPLHVSAIDEIQTK